MANKNKTKKRLSFTFFKKHKKLAIFLICLAIFVSSFAIINYSRYVTDIIKVYYLRSRNFYFNSNLLTLESKNTTYKINPWVVQGTEPFTISIEMNSRHNSLEATNLDIAYDITCEASEKIDCAIVNSAEPTGRATESSRVIPGSESQDYAETNKDLFDVQVIPKQANTLKNGEVVSVTITVTSTSPYVQTLSATFEITISDGELTYSIEDKKNQRYIDVIVTNRSPDKQYEVILTINDNYQYNEYTYNKSGDLIENDDNPVTGRAVIFDQSNAILDVEYGDSSYIDKGITYTSPQIIRSEGQPTIEGIKFVVRENSGALVRFYKKDLYADYSYNTNRFTSNNEEIQLKENQVVVMTENLLPK